MFLSYIKLEEIRNTFKAYFKDFLIELPEKIKNYDYFTHNPSNWFIIYSLGYDDKKIPCIYFSAEHKMTNPRHFLINEIGEFIALEPFQESFSYDNKISGDKEKKEQEFYEYNQKVDSIQRLNGVATNYNSFANINYYKNTHSFHYFWGTSSPFSQWHKCSFEYLGNFFNTAEQYMMFQKALLFEDYDVASKILETSNPKKQKELGRLVKNFDNKVWQENARRIVYEANKLKFLQNPSLLQELMDTKNKFLVEASPDDSIWGIGYAENDPEAKDINKWRGTNWLGCILTLLRNDIKKAYGN